MSRCVCFIDRPTLVVHTSFMLAIIMLLVTIVDVCIEHDPARKPTCRYSIATWWSLQLAHRSPQHTYVCDCSTVYNLKWNLFSDIGMTVETLGANCK